MRIPISSAVIAVAVVLFSAVGCKPSRPSANQTTSPPDINPPASPTVPPVEVNSSPAGLGQHAVKADFRNVLFHLTPGASAHLVTVSGELWPVGKYEMPVFDDKNSFELHVENGTISITPGALASIMNSHVFARDDAPLKDIDIEIKDGRLIIKGKLHSKKDLPFETAGDITVNADGRLRMHTEEVKALHVPLKKVMSLFGIELANTINTSKVPGMDTDKNDLILDLGVLLPSPHIRGKVSAARLGRNDITVIYGDGGKHLAPLPDAANYMLFRGNHVKFGKLTMEDTELALIDLDPKDPLDWDQDHYRDQLVVGYSKITANSGLRTFVKDYAKLPKSASKPSGSDKP